MQTLLVEFKKKAPFTHCCFRGSSALNTSAIDATPSAMGNTCFLAASDGSVLYFDGMSTCEAAFKVNAPVSALLFDEGSGRCCWPRLTAETLVVITDALLLVRAVIADDGSVSDRTEAKLPGKVRSF